MKTTKLITLMVAMLALCAAPATAQRSGGGGGRSGGGSHSSAGVSHSSSSSSRGGGYSSSSSRGGSSYSSSSRSYSAPSRSSSSSVRSGSSYSTPSRSGGTRGSVSRGGVSRSGGPGAAERSNRSFSGSSRSGSEGIGAMSRGNSTRQAPSVRGARRAGTTSAATGVHGRIGATGTPSHGRGNAVATPGRSGAGVPGGGVHSADRPREYARAGRPGGYMPPAARPIRPAPYFHHPWRHHIVHCHPIFWDPIPPRPWYWPGFWHYCHSYWYDYHVTDVVVVRNYVQETYQVDLVTYGISGDIMYAIVRDGGSTYLQVYDKDDHLLAEQKINRKYCNMVIDEENGGCWISKKNEKDPLLFIWADGKLLIYEED